MKYLTALIAFIGIFTCMTNSCNDSLTTIGNTIQPTEDLITVYTDTFSMQASTVKLDSIFAKTSDCLLGELYDPQYGLVKADFLCQFYCETGLKLKYEPYEGKIDSMDLYLIYPRNGIYGDSVTPMQVSIYPINKPIQRNFYSNDNLEAYCDMQHPLGATTYTAYNMSVSDSIYNLPSDDNNYYTPYIHIKLPRDLGQRFYEKIIEGSAFASQSAFNDFFPGIYVTTTYGSGCLIATSSANIVMSMYYNYSVKKDSVTGVDSLSQTTQQFVITKEVIQSNRFKNSNVDHLLTTPNSSYSYIKSPAGVCTKIVVPTTEIAKKIDVNDRYINAFTLNLKYLPTDEWDFAYSPPQHLLLLPEDSVKAFFENGNIEDYKTSFLSYDGTSTTTSTPSTTTTKYGYSPESRTYSFGNISALLKTHIKNTPDKDLNLLVLPVARSIGSYTSSNATLYYTISLYNSILPAGVKIRTDEENMKVVVLSSKFDNK